MVKNWIKQLKKLKKVSNIDFDKIILDILGGNYHLYDCKKMLGNNSLYRIRVGKYRIVFEDENGLVTIYSIGKRLDIYKGL